MVTYTCFILDLSYLFLVDSCLISKCITYSSFYKCIPSDFKATFNMYEEQVIKKKVNDHIKAVVNTNSLNHLEHNASKMI